MSTRELSGINRRAWTEGLTNRVVGLGWGWRELRAWSPQRAAERCCRLPGGGGDARSISRAWSPALPGPLRRHSPRPCLGVRSPESKEHGGRTPPARRRQYGPLQHGRPVCCFVNHGVVCALWTVAGAGRRIRSRSH